MRDGRFMIMFIKSVAIHLFMFITIFDPSNKIFGVKEQSFGLALAVLLLVNRWRVTAWIFYFIFFLALMTVYGALMAFAGVHDVNEGYPAAFAKALLFLSFMVCACFDDLQDAYIRTIALLSGFIIFVFVVNVTGGVGFISKEVVLAFTSWLTFDVEAAKIGQRTFGSVTMPMIYYKSAPLLVLALGLALHRERYLLSAVFCVALFLSGTRANMAFALFLPLCYLFFRLGGTRRLALIATCLFLAVLIFPFILQNFLNPAEDSNHIKIAHMASYLDFFDSNLLVVFVGAGIGALFYSGGFDAVVFHTELVYLDLLRYFGGVFLLVFLFFLLIPSLRIYQSGAKIVAVGYVGYLIISATNPLLISSTGMLAVTIAYLYAFKRSGRMHVFSIGKAGHLNGAPIFR